MNGRLIRHKVYMKTAPYVAGVIILAVLAGAVALAFRNNNVSNEPVANPIATSTSATDTVEALIRVNNPLPGQEIASGFELQGEARGNWFFEASFPAKIVDSSGRLVAQFVVQADGEWMTTDFVPFTQTVTFSRPQTATGTLVLMKDNPSGLPEHDREISIPVKFATSTSETMSVKVYLSNSTLAGVNNTDCSKVFPVVRTIPKTTATGKAAIEELLKGALATESISGYSTNLDTGVVLKSLTVTNGIAKADFNERLDENVGGSCRVRAIRSQIESTLKQFTSIKEVIISVNGDTSEVLQP